MKTRIVLQACGIIFFSITAAYATTIELDLTVNPSLAGVLDFYDYPTAESQLTEHPNLFVRENSEVIPTGLALANVLGYPNGRGAIGVFPHFEFGVSAGAAAYQVFRYQDYDKDNPEIPGGGVNAAVHFGTGIDDRMDIMFKAFLFGFYYTYDKNIEQTADDRSYDMEVTDNSLYSFGVKTRYHIIRPSPRSFFSFGGLNFNLAFDYMYARFAAKGTYFTRQTVQMAIPDPVFGTETPVDVQLFGTVDGSSAVQWHLFTVTPEVLAYFDVLYFVSVYSGFAVSINRGAVTLEADATGELHNTNPIVDPVTSNVIVAANTPIATARLHADSSMTPEVILPRFILGFEIDLFLLKLQLEGSSVLTSPNDSFTAQVGVRMQF